MSQSVAPLRGAGLVYAGSLSEYHGEMVLEVQDCWCPQCGHLEEWDPARRYHVRLMNGQELLHVRPSSLGGR